MFLIYGYLLSSLPAYNKGECFTSLHYENDLIYIGYRVSKKRITNCVESILLNNIGIMYNIHGVPDSILRCQ